MTTSQGCRLPAPSHYIKSAGRKGKAERMSLLSFFFSTRGQLFFLEAYQVLSLITHWPELGHMAIRVSEEMSTLLIEHAVLCCAELLLL